MPRKYKPHTVKRPVDRKLITARKTWLKEKYPKLIPERRIKVFARDVQLDYNTVVRYFDLGRTPAPLYLDRIQRIHKDFPV